MDRGWTIPIVTTDTVGITSTLTVFVRSDPFVVDADGDGMGDATERTLATLAPISTHSCPRSGTNRRSSSLQRSTMRMPSSARNRRCIAPPLPTS